MSSTNKTIKINIFKIDETSTVLSQNINFFSMIEKALLSKTTAEKRLMKLSELAEDQDLLSSFTLNKSGKYLFGTMMRLIPETSSGTLDEDLLRKEQISLDEVSNPKNTSLSKTLTNYFYFAINEHFLLTNSSKSIDSFQAYINWLVMEFRGNQLISFLPKMELPKKIAWEDLKTLEFGDNSKITSNLNSDDIFTKTTELTKGILQKVLGNEVCDKLSDTDVEQIISAKLILSIKKKSSSNKEAYEKVASIFAKPLENQNALTLITKDGKKLNGAEICAFKKINIPTVSNGHLNEATLKIEFEKILTSLEQEAKNE